MGPRFNTYGFLFVGEVKTTSVQRNADNKRRKAFFEMKYFTNLLIYVFTVTSVQNDDPEHRSIF